MKPACNKCLNEASDNWQPDNFEFVHVGVWNPPFIGIILLLMWDAGELNICKN